MITSRTEIGGADIAQHYDELDAFYRDVWGDHVHHGLWRTGDETLEEAVAQLDDLIADTAAIRPGDQVCDIGCGYGATARFLAEKRGAQVTAITISPAQHAGAVQRNAGRANPRFLVGDWLANDLSAASFQSAIAIECSEHMTDKRAFFAQAWRVLQPGGRLVVSSWLTRETPTPAQQRWLLEPICRESRMPQLGAESDYRQWATEAGFDIQGFQDVTRGIEPTWPGMVRSFLGHLLRHPSTLRILFHPHAHYLVFTLTVARLCVAFRTGALRYGIFTLVKRGA